MPKLSDLLGETNKANIQIGGSTVEFVFYALWRERFDAEQWSQTLSLSGREYLKMVLPRALVSWDLVDDDGHAVPVTAEAIEQHNIPDVLLFAIERRALTSDLTGHVRAELAGTAS